MGRERRNLTKRADVFQRVVQDVVANPDACFTRESFRARLEVPDAAAERILGNLISAGVLAEREKGVWVRTWPETIDRHE